MLYGDRGVGKSSLANIASHLLLKHLIKGKLFRKRCDSEDTFETIVGEALEEFGFFDKPISKTSAKSEGGEAGLRIPVAKAGVHTTTTKSDTIELRSIHIQPSTAAESVNGNNGLLLIDEVDAIKNATEKQKLAEFVKLLSDGHSPFKVLIVGIANTVGELTAGHPSVQRCLKETKLDRMSDDEIRSIVIEGSKKARITFSDSATIKIANLSSGYPHFTHLLCLKCAEDAINANKSNITVDDLRKSIDSAVGDAEGTLRTTYEEATRSASTDMYRVTLLAAAYLENDEFSASSLRESIAEIQGSTINQGSLNNYLGKLCSDGDGTVFRRVAMGVYKFNDPRMPSYIKIANGAID